MRQFTFTTHQTLAGCAAGWPRFLLDRHDRRLRFPIPSQQLQQPAAQVSLLLPPMSVGAKQLSQYFWLRRGRGWRLQIAIFNMLLQPEGGREAGCIFCFRVTVARWPRRRTKPKILRSLLSKANEWPAGRSPAHGVGEEAAASGRIFCSVSPSLLFTSISCLHKGAAQ